MLSPRIACLVIVISFTISLTASNLEWTRSYNGVGNDPDRIADIATDSTGNVYVLGTSTAVGTRENLLVVKFSPSGDTMWTRTIDYPTAHYETAVALALAENGDIVVTGTTYSVSDMSDILAAKLNSDGDLLWLRTFASPVHGDDVPTAVACDEVGNVYVTGTTATRVDFPALEDYITIKYNNAGDEQWVRQYDNDAEANHAKDIAVDSDYNIYVTGSCITLPGSPGPHSTTIKYLADGTLSWARMASDFEPNSYTSGRELEIDAEQNLYVVSSLIRGSNIHAMLTKYNSLGDTLWQRVYLRDQPRWETITGLVLMPAGGVVLTGSSLDIFTACYSAAGDTVWSRRWSAGLPVYRQSSASAVADNGNVYVSGCVGQSSEFHQIVTLGYSALGDSLFACIDSIGDYYRGEGIDISVSPDGNVYTGCKLATSSIEDFGLFKYSQDGALNWKKLYLGRGSAYDYGVSLVTDQSDNTYSIGYSCDQSCDIVIIKYAPDGNELWRSIFDGNLHGDDRATAAALDPNGHLIVVGSLQTATSQYGDALRDFWVAKFAENGDTIWTRTVDGGGSYPSDDASDVAIDPVGNIFVTGDSWGIDTDYLTVKFGPLGNLIWSQRYNGPGNGEDHAEAITVGSTGDIFVTGSSDGGFENDDILTIKYSNGGSELWVNRYDVPPGDDEDSGEDIVIGPDALPCVTGYGNAGLIVLKYTASGDTLWARMIHAPGDGFASGSCIDVDQVGNIFVGGAISMGSSNCSYQATDAVVIKFGADGQIGWQYDMDNPELCTNQITDLIADQQGGVFAIGWSGYPTAYPWDEYRRMLAAKISSAGVAVWSLQVEGTEPGYAGARDLSLDSEGKLFVIGATEGIGSKSDITTLKLRQNGFCGDADGSANISISDAVYLINYIFSGGPAPNPLAAGDADCSGIANISDAVYLINYTFVGGPAPCAACP